MDRMSSRPSLVDPSVTAAKPPLRLLVVDDSEDDVDLLLHALRGQGYQTVHAAVDNPADMRSALEREPWDVIISDHSMSNFDAPRALALAKELRPDVPFIIVSGEIDLQLAVALMKSGAQDYVQKKELIRLGQVIERELHDANMVRERKRAEDKLRESQEIFRAIVENVGDLVALLDTEGRRIYNSPSYQPFFREEDIRVGSDSFKEIHPEDRERIRAVFRRTVATGVGERAEFRFVLKDGSIRHIESEGRAIHNSEGKVTEVIVVSRDITARKRMETELLEVATTDFLTGLPNRRHFLSRLEEELARVQRLEGQRAAVLMLDADHFKLVNDRFGHATGDKMLRHLASLIRGELRKIDTAGRLGGEEFAIILPGADPVSAEIFAERLRQKVAHSPLKLSDQEIPLTVSIGVAPMLAKDADADAALVRADRALYRAKDSGRNRVVVAAATDPAI
jgi:diguanylate cyclase (GGDEF)-like protein/PAS domain S-box-containing protein